MTRARNLSGLSTVTGQPTTTTPVNLGPLGVGTFARIYGTWEQDQINAVAVAATNLQVSGITTGLNVSGIITAQNGLNINGNITNGLNVSAGIATFAGAIDANGNVDIAGNLTVAGTATYEDLTDIDSIGVGTFRKGIIVAGVTTANSSVYVQGNPAEVRIQHTGNGSYSRLISNSQNELNIYTGGGPSLAMTIDGSQEVGIGTASPARQLHINKNSAAATSVRFTNQNAGISTGGDVGLTAAGDVALWHGDAKNLILGTSNTERARITSQGRFGLGCTPVASHSNVTSSIQLKDNNTLLSRTGGQFLGLFQNIKYTSGDAVRYLIDGYGSAYHQDTGSHRFFTAASGTANTSATLSERLRITSAGRVGINENSPDTDLHIKNTNPALYLEGTNGSGRQHKIWTAGTNSESLQFTSGNLLYNADVHYFRATNESTEYARVDSSGRLLIGTTDIDSVSDGEVPKLIIKATDSTAGAAFVRHSANSGGTGIFFGKSRNATIGSNTIVQSGDELGRITFSGDDGTNINTMGVKIASYVDGTPGENDMPGRLVFYTTADGAASTTERMRINSSGNLLLGTTSDAGRLCVQGAAGGVALQTTDATNSTFRISHPSAAVTLLAGGSSQHLALGTGFAEKMRITSGGNIGFNRTNVDAGDNQTQNSTATPNRFVFNNDYSSGYTDASLKLYLFNDGATRHGFTSGPAHDLQYHASGSGTSKHTFYTQNVLNMQIGESSHGSVLKPTQVRFLARGGTTGDGHTANPYVFSTEVFDIGNCYDGTNKFTAPVAGVYFFSCHAGYKQTGESFGSRITRYNSSGVQQEQYELVRIVSADDPDSHSGGAGSVIMACSVGDYVQVIPQFTPYHCNPTLCFFCGYLLG